MVKKNNDRYFECKIAFFIGFYILSLSYSCNDRVGGGSDSLLKSHPISIINIEQNINNFKRLTISDINAEVEYIPLETPPDNLISRITSIAITDEYIAVSDYTKVLLFNRYGDFISEISRKGRGPLEHQMAVAIRIKGSKIYIPDALRHRILVFDINETFLYDTPIPNDYLSANPFLKNWWHLADTGFIVQVPIITGEELYRLVHINTEGKQVRGFANTTFFRLEKQSNGSLFFPYGAGGTLSSSGNIFSINNSIIFFDRLNDTILQVVNDTLLSRYIIARGKHGIPNQLRGRSILSDEIQNYLEQLIYLWNFFETTDYLVLRYRFRKLNPFTFRRVAVTGPVGSIEPKHKIYGLYNKNTQEFFFVSPSGINHQLEPLGIENDIDGGINFAPVYSPNERTLVSWFNAMDLKAHVASEAFRSSTPKYPERKRELEALANRLKDDDNPVLMVVTFKE